MRVFDPVGILRALYPSRRAAGALAARWSAARAGDPQLAADLIHMGRVLTLPTDYEAGRPVLDPVQVAFEAGQRDMAIRILALMGVNAYELNKMMDGDDD